MKKIQGIYGAPRPHWVGDGFPVRSLFSYSDHGRHLSPFLLLDHAGPAHFEPAARPRGVGQHPHRGFETVTIVYQGEVDHRDSTGAGGHIGPGDVQWMTAAAGIVHEEFHSEAFTRSGGTLEMAQLWVNLPASAKRVDPAYQTLLAGDIPVLPLADEAGQVRVIAGTCLGARGPAHTFTPMNVWDIRLRQGGSTRLRLPEGHTLALAVLRGTVLVNGASVARESQLVVFERGGSEIALEANNDVTLLLLGGEPIDEPVVGYGPFVMNSAEEIEQAIVDFKAGRFGQVA
jgi:quercetin 2,3-dioxygenase